MTPGPRLNWSNVGADTGSTSLALGCHLGLGAGARGPGPRGKEKEAKVYVRSLDGTYGWLRMAQSINFISSHAALPLAPRNNSSITHDFFGVSEVE